MSVIDKAPAPERVRVVVPVPSGYGRAVNYVAAVIVAAGVAGFFAAVAYVEAGPHYLAEFRQWAVTLAQAVLVFGAGMAVVALPLWPRGGRR